jgi:hypothetical protein
VGVKALIFHAKTLSSQRGTICELLAEFFAVEMAFFGYFGLEKAALAAGLCFPISLRGPVLCRALRRLASIWTTFRVDDMEWSFPG